MSHTLFHPWLRRRFWQKAVTVATPAGREAGHIRPVEHDGPDIVSNGLALSGTAHWMLSGRTFFRNDDPGADRVQFEIGALGLIFSCFEALFPTSIFFSTDQMKELNGY
ncbi:hypothetical protein [Shimia haliotis]|uniref:hypothetical protein n=1 Tax=Shimia haliotis TaxID=1280847 RepID=UPI0011143B3D|nr:hypothetical protein [Shimia haliotis]